MTAEQIIALYNTLVTLGIISGPTITTPAEAGLTEEQIRAIVADALRGATEKPWYEEYLPWIIAGGLGLGLLIVALRK